MNPQVEVDSKLVAKQTNQLFLKDWMPTAEPHFFLIIIMIIITIQLL